MSLCSILLFSCAKKKNEKLEPLEVNSSVFLNEKLTPDGCLNIPAYANEIKLLDLNLSVIEVPLQVQVTSKKNVRINFERIIAYGIFSESLSLFKTTQSIADNLQSISQDGCGSLTIQTEGDTLNSYQIKKSGKNFIFAESSKGEVLGYRWLSETQMEIKRKYIAYDMSCGKVENEVLVDVTKIIDWSGHQPEILENDNTTFSIQPILLTRVSEAVGWPVESLYTNSTDSSSGKLGILFSRLLDISRIPIRKEILSCEDSFVPNPIPEPQPGPVSGTESLR